MSRDKVALQNIANAARLVTEFVEGFNKSTFQPDWKTRSAVLYQLTVIGEAVKALSNSFRDQHPEIPWTVMLGMRESLIHGHDLIDWDEIWKTAKLEMPELLSLIEPLLS